MLFKNKVQIIILSFFISCITTLIIFGKIKPLLLHYNYLLLIPPEYYEEKHEEKKLLKKYYSLKNLTKGRNTASDNEIKLKILNELNKNIGGKNFAEIETIYLTMPNRFGNTIVMLNNILFYCEIFNCKYIYLNSYYNWFIKDNIIYNNININIMDDADIRCEKSSTLCLSLEDSPFIFFPSIVKPEIRINILKNEIKRNLPNVKINKKDLYIHIRSGDIFTYVINKYYSQPPLCFYQNILYNFKFRKIYIISENDNNPVINKLISEFPKIKFNINPIEVDIAYLSNAYNLVGSISSFLLAAVKLNDNLNNLWEYDLYRKSEKYLHLHHDIYNFPRKFIIYKMKPSEKYITNMLVWQRKESQLKLMIEEECIYNFIVIEPNI